MNRIALFVALTLFGALPALAQSTEIGVLAGGSRRFVEKAARDTDDAFLPSDFSLENRAIDLYLAFQIEPDVFVKLKGGRIETQIAYLTRVQDENRVRRDAEGEVEHLEGLVEYRFSEPFGSTGIFGGIGAYRQTSSETEATTDWGLAGGVNADFPLSRRYGILVEGTYHWTQAEFRARYVTLTAGLRVSF